MKRSWVIVAAGVFSFASGQAPSTVDGPPTPTARSALLGSRMPGGTQRWDQHAEQLGVMRATEPAVDCAEGADAYEFLTSSVMDTEAQVINWYIDILMNAKSDGWAYLMGDEHAFPMRFAFTRAQEQIAAWGYPVPNDRGQYIAHFAMCRKA